MESKPGNMIVKVIIFLLYLFLIPAVLLISAGTTDWFFGWVYIILILVATIGSRLATYFKNPDLLIERGQYASAEDVHSWDKALVGIVGIFGPLLMVLIAGLDHRFQWSQCFSPALQWVGAGMTALGYGLGVWAMLENKFFSAVVRIQEDRGHTVISTGPYKLLRHPSYAGAILAGLFFPLFLNSAWTLIPSVLMIAAVIIRTYVEDKLLIDELDGYREYTEQTKYRLIPWIW